MTNLNIKKILFTALIFFLLISLGIPGLYGQENTLFYTIPNGAKAETVSAKDQIGVYQQFISNLRGSECPMEPSCSNYALEAISQNGFVGGVLHGMDRLVRCGHEHQFYRTTFTSRGIKLIDFNDGSLNNKLAYKRKTDFYPYSSSSSNPDLSLVIKLIEQHLYHEALLEVNRIKYTQGKIENLVAYELLCLNALERYDRTIWIFETELSDHQKSQPQLIRQYYTAYYKMGNFQKVISGSDITLSTSNDPDIDYVKTLVFNGLLKEKQTALAQAFVEEAGSSLRQPDKYRSVLADLHSLKQKSPFIAGISNVLIPGVGYMYAGHTKTGITSLLFNSLFAYATYTSFRSGNTGMGLLTGLFGLAFYLSGVQGAVKSAHRYNNMGYNNIIDRFEQQTIIYH